MGMRGRPKGSGAYTIYNGMIPELRASGNTLQEIGDKCGVSRERIRQVLNEYYPDNLHPSVLTTGQLARELRMTSQGVRTLCKRLDVQPIREAKGYGHKAFWDQDTLAMLRDVRLCKVCGGYIPFGWKVYCSQQCQQEHSKYKYRSPEGKRKHLVAVRRWQRDHPEVVRGLVRKAVRKHQSKVLANRKYVIIKKCEVPMDAVVKNAGHKVDGKIPIKWEDKVYLLTPYQLRKCKQ